MYKRLSILFLICFYAYQIQAQTNGTLSVSVTTSSTGGSYSPRNILAIWVEDGSGKFVKTLLAYANTRKTHLNTWEASTTAAGSAFNSIDAITSATQSSHGTRNCSWNGTDYNGKLVPDGTYKIWMELTDKNSTGNVAPVTFIKSPNVQKLTPAAVPSFSSVSMNWNSSVTGIPSEMTRSNTIVVYPNPGTGQFIVLGENIKSLKVTDLSGKIIFTSKTPVFDLSGQPEAIYLVAIKTDRGTVVQKIIRK